MTHYRLAVDILSFIALPTVAVLLLVSPHPIDRLTAHETTERTTQYKDPGHFEIPPSWPRGFALKYRAACATLDSAIDFALAIQSGSIPAMRQDGCRPFRGMVGARLQERVSWGFRVHGVAFSVWSVIDQAKDKEYILLPDGFGPSRVSA